jgi:hypothetical protein
VHQRTGSEIRLLDDHPTVATIRLAKHRPDGIVDRSHWLNRACPARPATHVQPRGPPGVLFRSDCWPMPPDTAAPQGWHRAFRAVRSGSAAGVVAAGGRQRSWRGRCHFPCARRWRCRRPRRAGRRAPSRCQRRNSAYTADQDRHRYSGHEVAVSTVGLGRRTTYRRPRPLSSPTPCPTITPDQPPQQTSIQDLAPGRPPLRSAHRTVRVPRMPRVRWAGIRQ